MRETGMVMLASTSVGLVWAALAVAVAGLLIIFVYLGFRFQINYLAERTLEWIYGGYQAARFVLGCIVLLFYGYVIDPWWHPIKEWWWRRQDARHVKSARR